VSWRTISIDEFARITPVKPPIVNRKTKPKAHNTVGVNVKTDPYIVVSQLKILIPVGIAIIIVAEVK
jgi:hypothetical protein